MLTHMGGTSSTVPGARSVPQVLRVVITEGEAQGSPKVSRVWTVTRPRTASTPFSTDTYLLNECIRGMLGTRSHQD